MVWHLKSSLTCISSHTPYIPVTRACSLWKQSNSFFTSMFCQCWEFPVASFTYPLWHQHLSFCLFNTETFQTLHQPTVPHLAKPLASLPICKSFCHMCALKAKEDTCTNHWLTDVRKGWIWFTFFVSSSFMARVWLNSSWNFTSSSNSYNAPIYKKHSDEFS